MRYSTARAPDASPLECSRGFCNGLLAVLLLWLAACDELNSRGIAARVEGWDLGEDRLAELIILGQPFPLDSAAVSQLARHWEAAAALSFRFAAGDSLLGDEARAASLWLDRREAVLTADREERLGRAVGLDAAGVAGAFEEGSLRLAAHILRRVGPETSSSERLLQRRTTERLLNTLIEGGSWTQVVAESEDPSSRDGGGLLGLFAEGELPSTLDRALQTLEPGQVSGVVQSRDGFHLVYRPRYEEVAPLFADELRARRMAEADLEANEEFAAARGLAVVPGAVDDVSALVRRPLDWIESSRSLARWDGGSLTAAAAARYLLFLPPASRFEMADAPETHTELIRNLALRELRVADAEERGLRLDPDVEEALAQAHAEEVGYWLQALDLDPAATEPDRAALSRHMEALVSRREEPRSLSPLLEAWLLGRVESEVRERGVLAAIMKARQMLSAAESGEDAGL